MGSDVDLVAIVAHSARPGFERGVDWATELLPVPADLLVYTEDEWHALLAKDTRFSRTLRAEILWVWP